MPLYETILQFRGTSRVTLWAPNPGRGLDTTILDLSPDDLIHQQTLEGFQVKDESVALLLPGTSRSSNAPIFGPLPFDPWPENHPRTVKGYFELLEDESIEPGTALYQARAEELGQQLLFEPPVGPIN